MLPKDHEDAVLDAAEEIAAAEVHIRESCRSGMRLDDARSQFKYHQLQSRKDDQPRKVCRATLLPDSIARYKEGRFPAMAIGMSNWGKVHEPHPL